MAEKCLICESEVESDLCNVGKKGIIGLVKASVLRKDGKEKGFRGKTNGVVHNSCRREYVRSDSIKRFLRDTPSDEPSTSRDASSLRSGQMKFDFKTKCFFCTDITVKIVRWFLMDMVMTTAPNEQSRSEERSQKLLLTSTFMKARLSQFNKSIFLLMKETKQC